MYFYKVFGLTLQTPFPCVELLPSGEDKTPDIVIRYGSVPEALPHPVDSGARWQTAPDEYLLNLRRIGRFYVHRGREVVIQPQENISEESIRLYLLSACLSVLLHQRRLLALHVSGIHTKHGAILFAGNSGSGKSTLVSAFLARGYKMLADDMVALSLDDGQVMTLPGFPQVKLWADSAEALGRSTEGLRRVIPDYEKFAASELERFDPTAIPLRAIYVLNRHKDSELILEQPGHTARFNTLLDHTWQKLTIPGLGLREWHFQTTAQIASRVYFARVTRPFEPFHLTELTDLVENDFTRLENGYG